MVIGWGNNLRLVLRWKGGPASGLHLDNNLFPGNRIKGSHIIMIHLNGDGISGRENTAWPGKNLTRHNRLGGRWGTIEFKMIRIGGVKYAARAGVIGDRHPIAFNKYNTEKMTPV